MPLLQQVPPDAAALSSMQGLLRSGFLQITAQANPCSRHLWGTLARSVASIWWHQATPKNVPHLLSDSCILKCRQVICTRVLDARVEPQNHARRPHFINGSVNNMHTKELFVAGKREGFLIVRLKTALHLPPQRSLWSACY